MQKYSSLKKDIGKLTRSGFFPVIVSNTLAKACALLGSIIIVRILSVPDYGVYTKVINNYSILFILNDFGFSVAMMQYRGENYNDPIKRNAYFVEPFKYAMGFSLISSLIIAVSPVFFPYKSDNDALLTQLLCLTPILVTVNSFITLNLRVLTENIKYSVVNFAQAFLTYFFLIYGSYKYGVTGAVLSIYMVNIATIIFGVLISRGELSFDWQSKVLHKSEKIDFFKFAIGAQFNNSIGVLLHLFDVFLIGLIVASDAVLAEYRVASTIPQALVFIPNSIIIYIAPYFARKINDLEWIRGNTRKLIAGCIALNGVITIVGIIIAPVLVPLVFGAQYENSVLYFKILMVAFFFTGSFQIPAANVIFTQHKVRANIIITLISNVANCILDYCLIKQYGATGAAIATCAVAMISSLVAIVYLIRILRRCNTK